MAQHDYNIANDTAANVREDLNNVLAAIVSNNSGTSEPATTYANQWWYDSANDILKIRNEADTAWIDFATLDQANGVWKFPTDATPDTDSTYDLGEPSLKWANLYVDNISDGTTTVGTEYVVNGSAKAWAHIDVSGGVPSLGGSLNVSSITDTAVGRVQVSFTSAMTNASYSTPASTDTQINGSFNYGTGTVSLFSNNDTGPAIDPTLYVGTITGDLA